MSTNKLFVVGIGPGDINKLTFEAKKILEMSEVIVGYDLYVELINKYFKDKEYITTPMKQEIKRCELALESAKNKKITSVICSGDSSVYGMAGLILELAKDFEDIDIEIVPGITAALSGGAILGAPLGHDFSVISLSDLLTEYQLIKKRLYYAAKSDMCICIYNPSSKKRKEYLKNACEILLKEKSPETVCGIVKNIGRDGQTSTILTLNELKNYEADMFSTIFIGNKTTKIINGKMVTKRGYIKDDSLNIKDKFEYSLGIKDELFIREKEIPMTKELIRTLIISKLKLKEDSIVLDIGAGTGAVSVELAFNVPLGQVISVEMKRQAIDLINKNVEKFDIDNVSVIEGTAPDIIGKNIDFSHVFIGGSCGNFFDIIEFIKAKNKKIRVVATCVTLETLSDFSKLSKLEYISDFELVQANFSETYKLGNYNLMKASNPNFIVSFNIG